MKKNLYKTLALFLAASMFFTTLGVCDENSATKFLSLVSEFNKVKGNERIKKSFEISDFVQKMSYSFIVRYPYKR